jgi:thioredoxin-related protein
VRQTERLILAAVVLLVGNSVGAGEEAIAWQSDYQQALQTAGEQGRPMLVYVSRAGCKYCVLMKKRTFSKSDVARQINSDYVPVAIDARESRELVQKLKVRAYPTTLVIAGDEKTVLRIKGYVSADQFRKRLTVAKSSAEPDTLTR